MSPVHPCALILVTGASGYIASHVTRELLEAGYAVRGTVRRDIQGQYLSKLFERFGDRFEYVLVQDIAKEGAFDEAVKGVQGVSHIASPVTFDVKYLEDVAVPAVNGTVGILQSVKDFAPQVTRVVYMASSGSINGPSGPPTRYTEKDWNTEDLERCAKEGEAAPGHSKYRASKTLAEKAFWKFFEDEKPEFDGVTIHPPMVYGPIIHQCDTIDSLNMSLKARIWPWISGQKTGADLPENGSNMVDVRDVATALVTAMGSSKAQGERFIVSNGPYNANDLCLILAKTMPSISGVPKANEDKEYRAELLSQSNYLDGSKSSSILGIQYRTLEETVTDSARSLLERFPLN